jgi:hypothetical protein
MGLIDQLKAHASLPQPKEKKVYEVPESITQFMAQVDKAGVRLSYDAFSAILVANGVINDVEKPGINALNGSRYVGALPARLQALVCKNNGTYRKGVTDKWNEEAPEDFASRPIINDANTVVELFNQA